MKETDGEEVGGRRRKRKERVGGEEAEMLYY